MIPANLGDQLVGKIIRVAAVDTSATTNGTAIDLAGYSGEIGIILNAAHGSGNSDNTLAIKFQDSADGSTSWNDISGATFSTVDGTNDSLQLLSLNKDEVKRYIRSVTTMAGTSKSFVYGMSLVGMKKYQDGA